MMKKYDDSHFYDSMFLLFFFFGYFSLTPPPTIFIFASQWRNSRVKWRKAFYFLLLLFQAFDLSATCKKILLFVSQFILSPTIVCSFFYRFICFFFLCVSLPRSTQSFQCAAGGEGKSSRTENDCQLLKLFFTSFSFFFVTSNYKFFLFSTSQNRDVSFFPSRYCSILIKNSQHESFKYFTQFFFFSFSQPIWIHRKIFESNNMKISVQAFSRRHRNWECFPFDGIFLTDIRDLGNFFLCAACFFFLAPQKKNKKKYSTENPYCCGTKIEKSSARRDALILGRENSLKFLSNFLSSAT